MGRRGRRTSSWWASTTRWPGRWLIGQASLTASTVGCWTSRPHQDLVDPADIVVLHRVVCCYPDYERLLGAAADHARRLLVFSHPPRNIASRSLVALQNVTFRLSGNTFQTFPHPPEAMLGVLERRGMRHVHSHAGLVWQVAGLQRAPR